jgi:hypothetical protein
MLPFGESKSQEILGVKAGAIGILLRLKQINIQILFKGATLLLQAVKRRIECQHRRDVLREKSGRDQAH